MLAVGLLRFEFVSDVARFGQMFRMLLGLDKCFAPASTLVSYRSHTTVRDTASNTTTHHVGQGAIAQLSNYFHSKPCLPSFHMLSDLFMLVVMVDADGCRRELRTWRQNHSVAADQLCHAHHHVSAPAKIKSTQITPACPWAARGFGGCFNKKKKTKLGFDAFHRPDPCR